MELSKQLILNKVDFFIKVYENGTQVPMVFFKQKKLKPLEIFFNGSEKRLNFEWYDAFSNRYKKLLKNQTHELVLNEETFSLIEKLTPNHKDLLEYKISSTIKDNFNLIVKDEYFLLELAKYYNEEQLFPVLGFLDTQFSEIKIIEEDQLSITVRKSKSLINIYFSNDPPVIIDTSELLIYLKQWFGFIHNWKSNNIHGLEFLEKT